MLNCEFLQLRFPIGHLTADGVVGIEISHCKIFALFSNDPFLDEVLDPLKPFGTFGGLAEQVDRLFEIYLFYVGGLLLVGFDVLETLTRWSQLKVAILGHHAGAFALAMCLLEWVPI